MKRQKKQKQFNLNAFVAGIGSLLCILPVESQGAQLTDSQLLKNDWKAIGSDFHNALQSVTNESKDTCQTF